MDKVYVILGTIFLTINAIIVLFSMWNVFAKANLPGWGAFVPFYNIYLLLKQSGKPEWWLVSYLLWGMVPVVGMFGIVGLSISVAIDLGKRFGKGTWFALGLVFVPMIFWPILGFGSARYRRYPEKSNALRTPYSDSFTNDDA